MRELSTPLARARIAVSGVSDATTFRTPAIGAMRCYSRMGPVKYKR